jgi:hypothetical protein
MKNILTNANRFTLVVLLAVVGSSLFATVPLPASATGGPTCWPPPCVPIDGGISVLLIAGAALGIKKLYDSKKSSNSI